MAARSACAWRSPIRIARAIIVRNAVAREHGLGPAWALRRAFWKDRAAHEDQVIGPSSRWPGRARDSFHLINSITPSDR